MPLKFGPSVYPEYAAECGDPSRTKHLGFGNRPGILLINLCDAYLTPSSPLSFPSSTIETAVSAITRLLEAARNRNKSASTQGQERYEVPTFYTQTLYTHSKLQDAGLARLKTKTVTLFHSHDVSNLTSLPSQYPSLHPFPNDILIKKKHPSPFFGTNLASQLTALGVDTLLIAGFTTSKDIRAATVDAMQSGFRAAVIAEASGDHGRETHWANLMDLGAKYGDVVGIQEACDYLQINDSR